MEKMPKFETAEEALDYIRGLGFTLLGTNSIPAFAGPGPVVEEERPCGRETGPCCGGKCG